MHTKGTCQLFLKWVLRLLTVGRKPLCVDDFERCRRDRTNFLRTKLGSITTLYSQVGRQLSQHKLVNLAQYDLKRSNVLHRLPCKRPDIQQQLLLDPIALCEGRNREKMTPYVGGKPDLSQRQRTVSQVDKTDGKIILRIASVITVFARFGSQGLSPVSQKKYCSNEKMVAETEAYFKAKDKLFFKKSIEIFMKPRNACMAFE